MASGKQEKLFLVLDANALVHRAWHALPPTMKGPDGAVVNAVYGFASMFLKLLEKYQPAYIAACFDTAAPTFRHELSVEYKATREKKEDELYAQIPMIQQLLADFGVKSVFRDGYEADDVVGTLTANLPDGVRAYVLTGDADELQLVDERVQVLLLRTGISEMTLMDEAAVRAKYGFSPLQLIDYKALRGDTSDNIKGVAGIGEKTATALLQAFGSVEELYAVLERDPAAVEAAGGKRALTALRGTREVALAAKRMVTIVRDVPSVGTVRDYVWQGFAPEAVAALERYGFGSLVKRLRAMQSGDAEVVKDAPKAPAVELPSAVHESMPLWVSEVRTLYVLPWEGQATLFGSGIVVAVSDGERMAVLSGDALVTLARTLVKGGVTVIAWDGKRLLHALAAAGARDLPVVMDDLALMAYLVESGGAVLRGVQDACLQWLDVVVRTAQEGVAQLPALHQKLLGELQRMEMTKLYWDIEMPVMPVLFAMERTGILLDVPYFHELSSTFSKKLQELETKIQEIAGHSFNVNSPAQLSTVLFEEMKLPSHGIKRTQTNFSTAADQLEKIVDTSPIIGLIFEQRELQKLLSTYIDVLPTLVDREGRVHTTYQQTVTSTGRLSSIAPNLQNIPIQGDLGLAIRRGFVAPRGFVLMSADYSQVQLRIAASMTRDKHFLEDFLAGKDIHTATAARVFGVPEAEVTSEMRRKAKVINFGILYGMGAQALARGAEMPLGEARQFIARYFAAHPGIRTYMEETKLLARSRGWVETLFGRRRAFPDIASSVPMLRAAAERMAINMPIQGTEADLMKMAMIALAKGLGTVSPDSRLLLQVHDEMVLEVPAADVPAVSVFVRETMMGVAKLEVPLVVNIEVGKNWADME